AVALNVGNANAQSGNLYVSDAYGNTVRAFAPSGTDLGQFVPPGIVYYPQGLAFDSTGNLYVADNLGINVHEFDPSGASVHVFGLVTHDPEGLAFDRNGNLYVAPGVFGDEYINRISRPSPGVIQYGDFAYTGNPFGEYGLAIDSGGDIYAADAEHAAI